MNLGLHRFAVISLVLDPSRKMEPHLLQKLKRNIILSGTMEKGLLLEALFGVSQVTFHLARHNYTRTNSKSFLS